MKQFLFFLFAFTLFVSPALSQEKKSKELSTKELYEFSEKCGKYTADEFKKSFGSEGMKSGKDGITNNMYSNHYNAKLNKCFMMLKSWFIPKEKDGNVIDTKTLIDIVENKEIAELTIVKEKDHKVRILTCIILDESCNSEYEWEKFVKPYMEE